MTNHPAFSDCAAQLRGFISRRAVSDDDFNSLALQLFALQFEFVAPYHRFCESRNVTPETATNWADIPAMPIAGFKEFELTSLAPGARVREFRSSGTTAEKRSRNFHDAESLSIYEASLIPWFGHHVLADVSRIRMLVLTPTAAQVPHSSLAHMFETVRRQFGMERSTSIGLVRPDGTWALDLDRAVSVLQQSAESRAPLAILGTAYNFVQLLDQMKTLGVRVSLPEGSRVLETGGYKNQSRVLSKEELHVAISNRLDVSASHIVGEYGMCELSSQAYDHVAGEPAPKSRVFHFPPWAKARVVSVETGQQVPEGETGLIRICDLANLHSVIHIQTEDLGIRRGDGFELIGRAAQTEPRGCSLMSASA